MKQLFDLENVAILWFQETDDTNRLLILNPSGSSYPLLFSSKSAAFLHAYQYVLTWYQKKLAQLTTSKITTDAYLKQTKYFLKQLNLKQVQKYDTSSEQIQSFQEKLQALTYQYFPK